MALNLRNLATIAYANGFTLWHYKTDDELLPSPEEYFHDADFVRNGDLIIFISPTDTKFITIRK